ESPPSNPGVTVNPFFSRDGSRIAFQSEHSGRLEVWVMNADGGNPRQLSNVGVTGHFMRWSDNGREVIFRCTCTGKPATMKVSIDGGVPLPFAETTGSSHTSISPDRSRTMNVDRHRWLW